MSSHLEMLSLCYLFKSVFIDFNKIYSFLYIAFVPILLNLFLCVFIVLVGIMNGIYFSHFLFYTMIYIINCNSCNYIQLCN